MLKVRSVFVSFKIDNWFYLVIHRIFLLNSLFKEGQACRQDPPTREATMKVILDRRSIRESTVEPVSNEDIDRLEAAHQAPSGENAQPWRFVIVKDD